MKINKNLLWIRYVKILMQTVDSHHKRPQTNANSIELDEKYDILSPFSQKQIKLNLSFIKTSVQMQKCD